MVISSIPSSMSVNVHTRKAGFLSQQEVSVASVTTLQSRMVWELRKQSLFLSAALA